VDAGPRYTSGPLRSGSALQLYTLYIDIDKDCDGHRTLALGVPHGASLWKSTPGTSATRRGWQNEKD